MVCTQLRVFVIIFAEMLARQTEAGRGAAEGFSNPRKPFTGILYVFFANESVDQNLSQNVAA